MPLIIGLLTLMFGLHSGPQQGDCKAVTASMRELAGSALGGDKAWRIAGSIRECCRSRTLPAAVRNIHRADYSVGAEVSIASVPLAFVHVPSNSREGAQEELLHCSRNVPHFSRYADQRRWMG